MDLDNINEAVYNKEVPGTHRHIGIGTIDDIGNSFSLGGVYIRNIVSCVDVKLYVDKSGWIAIYFPRGTAAALLGQFQGLDPDNPIPRPVITRSTNVDGICDILDILGIKLVDVRDNVGWFHYIYPDATTLLLILKVNPGANLARTEAVNPDMPTGTLGSEVWAPRYITPACSSFVK